MIRIILLPENLVLHRKYSKLLNIIDIMKRIVFLLGMICITLGISAQTINSRSRITLKTAGEANRNVRLLLSDDFSNGWDNTWDANPAQDGGIYVFYQEAKYSIWASNEYSANLPLGFVSTSNLEYTLSFDMFLGTSYKIYDRVADQTIIVNGSTVDYNFTIDAADVEKAINDRFVINRTAYNVTLNDNFLATFSADENVVIPDGLNAYAAEYVSEMELLSLHPITSYIPANTGVILYNPNGGKGDNFQKNFSLEKYDGTVPAYTDPNDLKPASAYATNHTGHIYVLHGDMMYTYKDEASGMKPNKAFLQIDAQYPAPQRIAFRFNEEQGVENIEVEGKAVKFVENGRVFIKRGEKVYNLQGQLVK